MTMMPNRSLFNIQSSKITARARSRSGGDGKLSPGVPFSGQKRGLDQEELARGIGLSHPTMTRLVPADSSHRGDSVDTNFFQIERFLKK